MKHAGGVLGACKSKRALKNGRLLSEVGRDEEPPERMLGPCTDKPRPAPGAARTDPSRPSAIAGQKRPEWLDPITEAQPSKNRT